MTPNPETNNETLCFVSIVFPMPDSAAFPIIQAAIATALESLPQVKTEFKISTVRNDKAVTMGDLGNGLGS